MRRQRSTERPSPDAVHAASGILTQPHGAPLKGKPMTPTEHEAALLRISEICAAVCTDVDRVNLADEIGEIARRALDR